MKNIIFCADGTWNGPGGEANVDASSAVTNVYKLFCSLSGKDSIQTLTFQNEQERQDASNQQIAKYLHGVGDSSNPLVKLLGGAFGAGLISRIIRGHTFISRHYTHGDKIFLIGFSRGAYTVRALAGFINAAGLLDSAKVDLGNKLEAYLASVQAWKRYREGVTGQVIDDVFKWLPAIFSLFDTLKTTGAKSVPIEAVGVWDTVGAYGIPLYNLKRDKRYDIFKFADCVLSGVVAHGFQAVSIDEQRVDFTPTLWDPDHRIEQVLFAGAHADVGGGYTTTGEESALSNIALDWLIQRLLWRGVTFDSVYEDTWKLKPANPLGPSHQPWEELEWVALHRASRYFPQDAQISLAPSVLDRVGQPVRALPATALEPYNPKNISRLLP